MRLFAKYYQSCSPQVYSAGRRVVLKARRSGCPRVFFSALNEKDANVVSKMQRFGAEFFDYLFLLDIMRSITQWCVLRSLVQLRNTDEEDQIIRTSLSLMTFISCQLAAIRLLVINGLDVQARALCRPLREGADLLVIAQNNPDLANEFVSAQTPQETKEFWQNHVRKSRAKKQHIKTLFGKNLDMPQVIEELLHYIDYEESYFSQSIHPSYGAGIMHVFSLMDNSKESKDEFSFLSNSPSIRTMQYAIFNSINGAIAYLMTASKEPESASDKFDRDFIEEDEKSVKAAMLHTTLTVSSILDHLNYAKDG